MNNPEYIRQFLKEEFVDPDTDFFVHQYQVIHGPGLHWHDFFEIELVLSGAAKHNFNGMSMQVGQGDLFLVTPADFHELTPVSQERLELVNIKFSDELIDEDLLELLDRHEKPIFGHFEGDALAFVQNDCQRLIDEHRACKPGKKQVIRGTLIRILVELLRASKQRSDGKGEVLAFPTDMSQVDCSERQLLFKAFHFTNHHFREPITLKQVAMQANLSPNYFSGKFHAMIGKPFQAYLLELRLNYAKRLLACSTHSITEIAYASGFNTLPYFIRSFKSMYQVTPHGYRKQLLQDEQKIR